MELEIEQQFEEKKEEYEEEEKIHHHIGYNYYLKIQWIRWPLLIMISLIEAGNTSAIESPSSLQPYLQKTDMNLTTVEYEIFFSVTYGSLGVATLVMGYLINMIGPINGLLVCLACHCVSQLLFAIGVGYDLVGLMYFARIFSGIGETNFMCYTALIEVWFKNMEVSLAFSMLSTIGRSMAYAINYTLPRVREASGSLFIAFLYSAGTTFLIFLIALVMKILDKKYVEPITYHEEGEIVADSLKSYVQKTFEIFKKVFKNTNYMLILLVGSHIATHKVIFMLNSSKQLVSVFNYTAPGAAHFNLFAYSVASVVSVILSWLIFDRFGYRLIGLGMSEVCLIICYVSLNLFPREYMDLVYVSFAFFGFGAAFQFSTLWPCANSLIKANLIPAATGLVYCLLAGLMLVHVLMYGVVVDETVEIREGFFWANIYTTGLASIGLTVVFILSYRNWRDKGRLNEVHMKLLTEDEKNLIKKRLEEGEKPLGTENTQPLEKKEAGLEMKEMNEEEKAK